MKNTSRIIFLATIILVLAGCQASSPTPTPPAIQKPEKTTIPTTSMTEAEAKTIAEATCIKGGESLTPGYYNENSKTWWFDANLNATKPGCIPACVVSEESKTAEVNWRCTGLIPSEEPANNDVSEAIRQLFAVKYPEFAKTVSVKINLQDEAHVRGQVSFEEGAPGGIFFAVKKEGNWKIVHDGNGQISCSLSADGFSAEMLNDCAKP
jgi:hypothetical protein